MTASREHSPIQSHENGFTKMNQLIQEIRTELQRLQVSSNQTIQSTALETQATTLQRLKLLLNMQQLHKVNLLLTENNEKLLYPHLEKLTLLLSTVRDAAAQITNYGYWDLVFLFVPTEVYKQVPTSTDAQNVSLLRQELYTLLNLCYPKSSPYSKNGYPLVIQKFFDLLAELDRKVDARFELVQAHIAAKIASELMQDEQYANIILRTIPYDDYVTVADAGMLKPKYLESNYAYSTKMGYLPIQELLRRSLIVRKAIFSELDTYESFNAVVFSDISRFLFTLQNRYSGEIPINLKVGLNADDPKVRLITKALLVLTRKITAHCLVLAQDEVALESNLKKRNSGDFWQTELADLQLDF